MAVHRRSFWSAAVLFTLSFEGLRFHAVSPV
jgi:hypothetical protein